MRKKKRRNGEKMEITIGSKKHTKINQDIISLFLEDINYGMDGGLYAEMIENGNFEALDCYGDKADYYTVYDGTYAWSLINGMKEAKMFCVTGSPLTEENPHYLRFTAESGDCGIKNKAYDGIYLKEGMTYHISFYARSIAYSGTLEIRIQKDGRAVQSAPVKLAEGCCRKEKCWMRYEADITADETMERAEFTVILNQSGTVEFDCFSMMPADAAAGIFRRDLFEMLCALKPGFIRFPGGCVLEGNTLMNRYHFKDTLKPVPHRKQNWNRWATHNNSVENDYHGAFAHYNQSLGIGYYEYFLLCEMTGAKPLPVVNLGLACQFQSFERAEMGTEAFTEFVEEALELIEFANGACDTKWGAARAKMGHPESFGLRYLCIGNEQWETKEADIYERYCIFEQRIHEMYPEIELVGSAGPDVISEGYEQSWKFFEEGSRQTEKFAYAVDEHYYMKPEWFLEHTDFYDKSFGSVKAAVGEYAAHPAHIDGLEEKNTLEAALSEAAYLLGVMKNSDHIMLACYAPVLARSGYAQWGPDLIWFDGAKSYGTPSYYVQLLLQKMCGMTILDEQGQEGSVFYITAQEEVSGDIYSGIVNTGEEVCHIWFAGKGGSQMIPEKLWSLGGKEKDDCNSLTIPEHIIIEETDLGIEKAGSGEDAEVTIGRNTFAIVKLKKI